MHPNARDRLVLLPVANAMPQRVVLEAAPQGPIAACDFYVEGAESGDDVPGGYRLGRILNVDHHAPTPRMSRMISSTNLAIAQVEAETIDSRITVVVNHTDCDSILSGAIMSGLLPPAPHYGEAALAADHTGEENAIADLLQSLDPLRDPDLSLRNLAALERGDTLDPVAVERLRAREHDRSRAEAYVARSRFSSLGCLWWAELDGAVDGAFLPSLLPDACVILLAMPLRDDPTRWEMKLRLGLAAPDGLRLHDLGIQDFDPAFGGRWNAGANRRAGGTSLAPDVYAARVSEVLSRRLAMLAGDEVRPGSL